MYAIVDQNGAVVDLVSLPDGVTSLQALTFLTPEQIAAAIAIPSGVYPNVGWIYSAGAFTPPAPSASPPAPPPTPVQRAQTALAAGWAVVSSGTPEVSGTYALDIVAQIKAWGVVSYLGLNGRFPGGASTISQFDTSGAAHVFPTREIFLAWATALADYVAALDLIIASGTGTLPAQPTKID